MAVADKWQRLAAEKDADISRLSEIAKEALAMHLEAENERDAAVAENVRLQAFVDCHTNECYGCPCCSAALAGPTGDPE